MIPNRMQQKLGTGFGSCSNRKQALDGLPSEPAAPKTALNRKHTE